MTGIQITNLLGRKVKIPGHSRKGSVCEVRYTGTGRTRKLAYAVVSHPQAGMVRLTHEQLSAAQKGGEPSDES
jgi:hypothetical protein